MKVIRPGSAQSILLYIIAFAMICVVSCHNRHQGKGQQPLAEESPVKQVVPEGWESLIDNETLGGWEIIRYGGEGNPYVHNGILTLPMAVNGLMTGVYWTGKPLPVNNYVIYYEARRMAGNDFFAGLSFPYGDTFATLIVGGWAGSVCGLSSIDGNDASGNETTRHIYFKDQQWYPVQLRVTTDSIRAVIDTMRVVDIATAGKRIHLREGTLAPGLSLCTYLTTGEIRNMRIKRLP